MPIWLWTGKAKIRKQKKYMYAIVTLLREYKKVIDT